MSQTGLTLTFIYRGRWHVPNRSYTSLHISRPMHVPYMSYTSSRLNADAMSQTWSYTGSHNVADV
ncbi:Uncharacterized protein F383_20722 [Gossypium arboreum]|uniref:Uncharacterized protein n=1 Tax=Gossypium arboreum TaxID=29729 RepID=A0A0B0NZZ7_GOSAR|nr:Uncharacterized protein F383_20722 [Gossypium arboreum]